VFIEITGIPGSGKTTLYKEFRREMWRHRISVTDINLVASDREERGWLPRYVRNKPQRELLHRFARFMSAHPELIALCNSLFGEDEAKRLLFLIMVANFQAARDLARPGEVIVLEEGFLTHAVAACHARGDQALFQQFLSLIPPVDALVYLDVPAEIAYERAVDRKLNDQHARQKLGGPEGFASREAAMRTGVETYGPRCGAVLEIGPGQDVHEDAAGLAARIRPLLAAAGQGAARTA
jgi:thymidylate kinase